MKQILSFALSLVLGFGVLGFVAVDDTQAQTGNLYQPGIFYQPRTGLGQAPIELMERERQPEAPVADAADPVITHVPPMIVDKPLARIVLEADATDDTGIDSVTMTFSTNRESSRHTFAMNQVTPTKYKVALPHRREGTVFRYYFTATDLSGNTVSTKEYTLEKRFDRYDDEQRRTENRTRTDRVNAGGDAYDTRATRSRVSGLGILNIPKPRALNINRPFNPTPPAPVQARTHTVRNGDSLGKIAMEKLGSSDWRPLFDANKDQISDPNLIRPGMILRLP